MPRHRITSLPKLEWLSILDERGTVDETHDPQLSDDQLRSSLRAMLMGRRWDERMITLSRQGRIATYPSTRGQEAASIGPAFAMESGDWLVPSFREMPAMLLRGWPMHQLILGWWGGHEYGASGAEGLRILPLCGPVATQLQYAAGIAMGCKRLGGKDAVLAFVGDGGTSEGDFHEAMNVAGVFRLPLVTVVQNNQWAISMPRCRQTAAETIAQKALAYGFNGIQADGNDILGMIVATREALERARMGGGPTMIEALTYRMGEHSTSDNSMKYRSREELAAWAERDPIARLRTYLARRGIIDDAVLSRMEAEIAEEISVAVTLAESYQPNEAEPFEHCYAEMSADLVAQREQFIAMREGDAVESAPVTRRGQVYQSTVAVKDQVVLPSTKREG